MKITFLFSLLLLSFCNIYSQNFWQSSGQLNGGHKYSMIYTPSGTLLVGSGDRIYKYDGNTFQTTSFVGHGDIHAFAIDPKNGYLYTGTESYHETLGGVYISYNEGNDWYSAGLSGKGISDIVVDSGGVVIASVYADNNVGFLFRSTDRGATWTTLFNNSNYGIYCVAKDKKNNLYTGIQNPNNFSEAILFKSQDRGLTWNVLKTFIGQENKVRGIGIDSSGNNILVYTQSGGKVYLSTDAGSTWLEKLSGLEYFNKVPIEFNKSNHVFVGSYGGGVYRSKNGGVDWEQLNSGLTNLYVLSFTTKDNYVFCGTTSSLYSGQIVTPPIQPTLKSPLNGSTNIPSSITLEWLDSPGSSSYRVQVSKELQFLSPLTDSVVSDIKCGINNLEHNTQYFWRVNATNSEGISSWSDIWSFTTIGKSINLISPNGGENWLTGNTNEIIWISSGVTNVKIELSTDNGTNWDTIISNTPANNESYLWSIPNIPSSHCKIKISDVSNPSIYDISDNLFVITSIGLIAYYPFNGNANDESGYGNNGLVNNATLTQDRFGNASSAYSFDGINSVITVPHNSSLQPTIGLTLSAWVSFANLANTSSILGKGSDAQIGWYSLRWEKTSRTLHFQINFSDFPVNGRTTLSLSANIQTNVWYHIVGVFDGSTMKLYLNGTLGTSLSASKVLSSNNEVLQIGSSVEGYHLNGVIDDIHIYNYALTESKIDSLYHVNNFGGKIFFCLRQNNDSDVWYTNLDSSITKPIIQWSGSNEVSPVISPDGLKIAFVSSKSGSNQVWVTNIDGTNPQQVTNGYEYHSGLCWMPDNQHLIYSVSIHTTNTDIYSVNIDGTELTPLINGPTYEYGSNIDPNQGRYLIYKFDTGAWGPTADTKVYDLFTRTEKTIVDCNSSSTYGCYNNEWSPDAQIIAFERDTGTGYATYGGPTNIYIMNTDGTNFKALTNLQGYGNNYRQPCWSPDGQKLVFVQSQGDSYSNKLLFVNVDGSGTVSEITLPVNGQVSFPFWGQTKNSIKVISPNGGENWQVGSVYNINWISDGIANVQIKYSTNNGTKWETIMSSTPANSRNYSWTIPNTPSKLCKIKISDVTDSSIFDISDNTFIVQSVGLIAYYPFNGNANDESGNGNNGNVYDATLTSDRFGKYEKAYNFNGGTNRIQADIANIPVDNDSRTISLWANGIHNSNSSFWSECILVYGGGVPSDSGKDAFGIYYNHDPLLTGFGVGLSYDIDLFYLSSNQFFDGRWKHIVVVYNQQSSKMTFYIDTQKIDEQEQILNTVEPYYHFNIGIEQGSGGLTRPFYGKIDDIRFYNYALSENEILQLYHEGGWSIGDHFSTIWESPFQAMNIYITAASINGIPLKPDDEIGVYDGEICVGAKKLTEPISTSPLSIIASKDDPTTSAVDGFIDGHTISFRIWDNSKQIEYNNVGKNYVSGYSGIFVALGTTIGSLTDVGDEHFRIPIKYNLYQSFPNPFNPATRIRFDIPKQSQVKLVVYDILGREIEKLVDKEMSPGSFEEVFEGKDLPSGIYFYRLTAAGYIVTKKMQLIK